MIFTNWSDFKGKLITEVYETACDNTDDYLEYKVFFCEEGVFIIESWNERWEGGSMELINKIPEPRYR